jgi:hypothetical protein
LTNEQVIKTGIATPPSAQPLMSQLSRYSFREK